MSLEQLVAQSSRGQHGLVTWRQMCAVGVTNRELDSALAAERIERVHHEIYRFTTAPRTWHQSLLAACLVADEAGVASHRSAAALWGLGGVPSDLVEIEVPRARAPRPPGVIVHRSTDLLPVDISSRHGILVTNPIRVLADIGQVEPLHVVRMVTRDAISKRLVNTAGIETMLTRVGRKGRNGAGPLRKMLAELPNRPADSLPEYDALARFHAHGLYPEFQYEIWHNGRLIGRVDYCFPEALLIVEFNGADHYTTWDAIEHDARRESELSELGYLVLSIPWSMYRRNPDTVIARIGRVRTARLALLGTCAAA